jgi:hypothetical protein
MKQLSHSIEAGMAATGLSRVEFCRRWQSIRRQQRDEVMRLATKRQPMGLAGGGRLESRGAL